MDYTEFYQKYPVEKNYELILDSGAFTAWTKKVDINIDDYIEFLKKYTPYVIASVNLDVIPAEFGRKPTLDEIHISAQKGWDNLKYMEERGIRPIPVFHQDENFKFLRDLIESGHDYIGISPANDRTTSQKIEWLDKVFKHISNKDGNPVIKTHGFAVTALTLLIHYPWSSVDSASWVRTSSYGAVYIPQFDETTGIYNYQVPAHRVYVSEKSPSIKTDKELHYLTLPPDQRRNHENYFSLKGFTYEELETQYKKRDQLNVMYFNDLERELKERGFSSEGTPKAFFPNIDDTQPYWDWPGVPMKTKIYLATAFCDHRNIALTKANSRRRLVSYWYHKMGKVKEDYIPKFVKQGYGNELEIKEVKESESPIQPEDSISEGEKE